MTNLVQIILQYKNDNESVYNTWFIDNNQRLKAFRTIRRGVLQVIEDIKNKTFPNDFKESSLEFVLNCIAEQKQVFAGVSHPFYWKPKLRIPDIYENQNNKLAFGQFLENCINAKSEEQVVKEIIKLDELKIKGLGPAVASILYFIHPTWFPPFNTAILNGFNFLFKDKKKLGSWTEYLKIRETLIETNTLHKSQLSNDLGAIAGLFFEIGTQKMLIGNDEYLSEAERSRFEKNVHKRQKEILEEKLEENLHSEMQYHLLKIGVSLGFDVTPASNDKNKSFNGQNFSFISLEKFPELPTDKDTQNTIKLIDVLWFEKSTNKIIGAFEVEKSTSIYSGILRLSDLYFSISSGREVFYIIIPNHRERDVVLQLNRPVIKNSKMNIKYILFSELRANCDAICKFGTDHSIMEKISISI
ncbi:MAG: hypothetical protein JNM71_17245 [Flavobacterium lindanitolerans]|uniref:Type II restriction endonuclease n=1 Tax=Flavobacterium microcysteis TaxID=2596891 RepID=A0A501Q0J4_9FLAO|nr:MULTISPECIES: hypothetical protein [Flavobacterium]MBL7869758.1 hypothetical protein [Flavobacterium lindanitolerans]MDL2143511.1 hypothetical protein [Flavobacterium tructae]TPD65938.1 hypothetical protein FJA49_17320 [Flavobacterium microcysteis]